MHGTFASFNDLRQRMSRRAALSAVLLVAWMGIAACDNGRGPAFRLCGNGVLDPGESCDDGNLYDDDDCLSTCVPARCGDGFVALFGERHREECEPGHTGTFCLNALPRWQPCRGDSDCPRSPEGPFLPNPCQAPSCNAFGLGSGFPECTSCQLDTSTCGPPPTPTRTPLPASPTPTRTPRPPRTPTAV